MTKCKFTTVACQGGGCQKEFQRDQYHPNCTLCPECRKARNRQANRENQRAKYHAMKEEDREFKREHTGVGLPATSWDLYRRRKQRERERRRQAAAGSELPENHLKPVSRALEALEYVGGERHSGHVLQIVSLLVIAIGFLEHGCLEDFQEHLACILRKLCHEPGGSASPSRNAMCIGIERFLHAVGRVLPALCAHLSPRT